MFGDDYEERPRGRGRTLAWTALGLGVSALIGIGVVIALFEAAEWNFHHTPGHSPDEEMGCGMVLFLGVPFLLLSMAGVIVGLIAIVRNPKNIWGWIATAINTLPSIFVFSDGVDRWL